MSVRDYSTPVNTHRVLEDIRAERGRQEAKWGQQDHPDGTGPDNRPLSEFGTTKLTARTLSEMAKSITDAYTKEGLVEYADILLEEVFEALAEQDPDKLRTELIQVAAVAAQWAEAIDRRAGK